MEALRGEDSEAFVRSASVCLRTLIAAFEVFAREYAGKITGRRVKATTERTIVHANAQTTFEKLMTPLTDLGVLVTLVLKLESADMTIGDTDRSSICLMRSMLSASSFKTGP
jgi:hypothetical protein